MIERPAVTTTREIRAAVLPVSIHPSEIREVMGAGIGELMETLAAQGVAPAGPLFTHYTSMQADRWDFEIGIPVNADVTPSGRVLPGRLPAATVAHTTVAGPYEELPAAWGEFMAWVAQAGLKPATELWEVYLIGPESGEDASQYRTELYRVLRD